jgi:hypothetical protein
VSGTCTKAIIEVLGRIDNGSFKQAYSTSISSFIYTLQIKMPIVPTLEHKYNFNFTHKKTDLKPVYFIFSLII